MFKFNSREEKYKKPFGAIRSEEPVFFTLMAQDGVFVESVELILTRDGGEQEFYNMRYVGKDGEYSKFCTTLCIEDSGLYWYRFSAKTERGIFNLYCGRGGELALENDGFNESFQLSVYDKNFTTPEFIKGGLIYHIFVDRFSRGLDKACSFKKNGVLKSWDEPLTIADPDGVFRANDFYGGNLQGITDKLDYLNELGVSLLYLSPIFKSGSNHRYDTGDYMQIDELIGDEESFKKLIAEARKRGIGIMLDGVFNHTGSDSLYFNKLGNYKSVGAYQSKKSPYSSWYYFSEFPESYDCWWGITVTPTVTKSNPEFCRLIVGEGGVIEKYTKLGVAGWRLDVVDELESDFVEKIRRKIKAMGKENLLIGEVWEDASNKISYSARRQYLFGSQLDGTMNYPFKKAILDYICGVSAIDVGEEIRRIIENYPKQCQDVSMVLIDTHDTWRALNTFSGVDVSHLDKQGKSEVVYSKEVKAAAKRKLKAAVAMQYILPGVPSIYYGDEVGLDGYDDPLNRKTFPWDDMDKELLAYYQKLGRIRKNHKKALMGTTKVYSKGGKLVILRDGDDEVICFMANNSKNEENIDFFSTAESLLHDKIIESITLRQGEFDIVKFKKV